jgi:hypothetical protein
MHLQSVPVVTVVAKDHVADKLAMILGYKVVVQHKFSSTYVHQADIGVQQVASLDLVHAALVQLANMAQFADMILVFADHVAAVV